MAKLGGVLGMTVMAALLVGACGDDDDGNGAGMGGATSAGGAKAGVGGNKANGGAGAVAGANSSGGAAGGAPTTSGGAGSGNVAGGGVAGGGADGGVSGGGAGGAHSCWGFGQTVWDIINKACTPEGAFCEFGMECCCGQCVPDFVCFCEGGTWGCHSEDICMQQCGGATGSGGRSTRGGAGAVSPNGGVGG